MSTADRLAWALALVILCCVSAACEDSSTFDDRKYSRGAIDDDGSIPGDHDLGPEPTPPTDSGLDASGGVPAVQCEPAVAADALRARSTVMSPVATTRAVTMSTGDLFELFSSHCRGCHIDQGLGNFKVTRQDFHETVGVKALARIKADEGFMPPDPIGKPWKDRAPGDPVVEFATLLEAWIADGRPQDRFDVGSGGGGQASATYLLGEEVGMALTNMGNCVPSAEGFAAENQRSLELDEMFRDATELPERLEQTDMFTLDARTLASYGVVAFAPTYTLFSANAKKIRMVRVPRGEAIGFDPEAQEKFSIPPNTRFYKTFLKRVIDAEGNESYRKMETRLIVSRPDRQLEDGSYEVQSLFGTYAWNEQETEAVLVRDPLRNGKPFRDRLVTYSVDEPGVEALVRAGETDLDKKLLEQRLTATYAIPGSERCIHCHMGAPGGSFILGFTPLQVNRRPLGDGGVIEPAERDELNQLQRLIDYGVISGMTSPEDVTLLEDTQGERKPRNEHELVAQGYLLGNCSHCHNERGFPSVTAPELRDVLNFLPGKEGGVFQFPLDRFSPRIFRGERQDIPIPYITPSLFDLGAFTGSSKVHECFDNLRNRSFEDPLLAPWRSLIYRNVDGPFSYTDGWTIFPHMPRDVAGYDCRARQLLGTWMTSITSRWVGQPGTWNGEGGFPPPWAEIADDATAQPYEEVTADDPDYRRFERAAKARVKDFQTGRSRFNDCPDPNLDFVDPGITSGERLVPRNQFIDSAEVGEHVACGPLELPIPERAHWAVTDLTEPPVAWSPRRPDWREIVEKGNFVDDPTTNADDARVANDRKTFEILRQQNVRLTPALREVALQEFPMGLWLEKPECDLAGVTRASDVPIESRPAWMRGLAKETGGDLPATPVYSITPGAQVFTQICRNCHGPLADSRSRNADTIADLTGGATRVANLRDGIFGPVSDPGENRREVFEVAVVPGSDLTPDDWAGRYLVWMGLGGTQRVIPPAILTLVANTPVLGIKRGSLALSGALDANMLTVAQTLCREMLPNKNIELMFDVAEGNIDREEAIGAYPRWALITENGDAEVWQRICTVDNPAPVRVIHLTDEGFKFGYTILIDGTTSHILGNLYERGMYPDDAVVGNHLGQLQAGIQSDNLVPWCILRPESVEEEDLLVAEYWAARGDDSEPPPFCPDGFVTDEHRVDLDDLDRWSRRGAMNAGLSVFLYLDALAKGEVTRTIAYDRCEELAPP